MFWFWLFVVLILNIASNLVSSCDCLDDLLLGGKYESVDLSYDLHDNLVTFKEEGKDWPTKSFMVYTELGTMMRAPSEYDEKGPHVGEISTQKLIVQMIMVDVSSKIKDNSSYVLCMQDLESVLNEELLYHISSWPSLFVISFGWSKYFDNMKYYGKAEDESKYNFPAVGEDVAQWLSKNECSKNLVGVGTDLPHLHPPTKKSSVHPTLAKGGLYIIEGLNLTQGLPEHKCIAVVSPLKINEASSVPVNVVAMCPTHSLEEKESNKSKRYTCQEEIEHEMKEMEHEYKHETHGSKHEEKEESSTQGSHKHENKPGKQHIPDKKPSSQSGSSESSVSEITKPSVNKSGSSESSVSEIIKPSVNTIQKIKDKIKIK